MQGEINCQALSIAINNNFSKEKINYPTYDEMFVKEDDMKEKKEKKISPKNEKNRINLKVQEEFNAWARF